MLLTADFDAELESELSARAADLVLPLEPPTDEGWVKVARLTHDGEAPAADLQSGFVPADFLEEAPADGVMMQDFDGESAGVATSACRGEVIWVLSKPVDGWVTVIMGSGMRGRVPQTGPVHWEVLPLSQFRSHAM